MTNLNCIRFPSFGLVTLPRPSDLAGYFDAGTLADAANAIPDWAAAGRSDIVRLWIPKTVVSVGSCAFKGCVNLEEVVFEASFDAVGRSIGMMAFAGCPKLAKVQLSASVRNIGSGAFRDDSVLRMLLVDPSGEQPRIGPHAFDNCPSPDELRSFRIPPQFADCCAWEKLNGLCWVKLLQAQPQFADRCAWEKLDDAWWRILLKVRPELSKWRVRS